MKRLKALIILLMEILYLIIALSISCIAFGFVIGYLAAGYAYKKLFSYDTDKNEFAGLPTMATK